LSDLSNRSDAFIVARAEERAAEEEYAETTTVLDFTINHHVPYEHSVWIVGSVRELGDWDPKKGIPLEWSEGDIWRTSISMKRHEVSKLEYKYLSKFADTVIWESGKNHNILPSPAARIVVRDQWEFPGFNFIS